MKFLVVLDQLPVARVQQDGQAERLERVGVVGPVGVVELELVAVGVVVREIVGLEVSLLGLQIAAHQRLGTLGRRADCGCRRWLLLLLLVVEAGYLVAMVMVASRLGRVDRLGVVRLAEEPDLLGRRIGPR